MLCILPPPPLSLSHHLIVQIIVPPFSKIYENSELSWKNFPYSDSIVQSIFLSGFHSNLRTYTRS